MNKKVIATLGIVGFLASAGMAFAQTTNATETISPTRSRPMVLDVNRSGKVLLRGTVDSVSTGSITLKSWGGEWTVNVPSSADVLPSGAVLSNFKTGDFVGVSGSIDSSDGWTVDATLIRDWSTRQTMNANEKQAHETMSQGPRVIQGTLSNLDATAQTFTLTNSSGTAYSVTLNSGAELINKNWTTILLSQANSGDTVRVYGTVSSTTIAASVFRDVTVK